MSSDQGYGPPQMGAHENTIPVELSEYHYWILVQALSAAGTASHRHGMAVHARKFHEVEKHLYGAYEKRMTASETEQTNLVENAVTTEPLGY